MILSPVPKPARPPIKLLLFIALIFIVLAFGGSYYFAINAPLQSAAIATGQVVVESFKKEIQHLDGGIVKAIHVKDGDRVANGDLIVSLDEQELKTNYDLLDGEKQVFIAQEARLSAEKNNIPLVFPTNLNQDDEKISRIIEGQTDIYETNVKVFTSLKEVHLEQIAVLKLSIEKGKLQVQADKKNIYYLTKEFEAVNSLFQKNKIQENSVWEVQGRLSKAESLLFEHERNINNATNSIIEIKKKIVTLENEHLLKTVNELKDVRRELAQIIEKQKAIELKLKRTKIYAPISGTIVNSTIHTVGGAIKPFDTLIEIVPINDRLIIEAKIKPNDIESVRPGLFTHIKLSAYNTRYLPDLSGVVIYVSPDAVQDEKTREYNYIGRIEITSNDLIEKHNLELYPGMITEVLIVTDKRTFWDYFTTPIVNSLNRAFREK